MTVSLASWYLVPRRRGSIVKSRKDRPLLTNREREVFDLLVQSKTTKDIAALLFISEKTVRNHISNVIQKLGVKGRSQAVVELVRLGEIEI
ncbi:helix-turn-helix transcriptional regulator [Desulfuribacillus alkaliarsenatis]|uniref:Helix-turn-helix transcriptional regulator n=1 Tax=Desulfuribacillus alkaliarsenatis TaxID=766136 RepID=A0A1E5G6G4_9FIRM|nr:helix-turn-helix transcriptional regulator [Desulfuribacillus alkaliarsenatis]